MNPSAVSLDVHEASVSYGAHPVLDRVSLSAAGGEFIALLGASGCGKTTLLRAICGFVGLTGGSIAVAGRDITRLPPDKRNIAMVFQSYALWPHMTVAQNMGYGLKLRGVGRARIAERVAALLAMLRLEGLGERKVTALSGGQRQRVALGRALAIDPQVLLLDEPLSNLDARIREEVRHEIKTVQQNLGITTVHVTHDRQEAMVMADRIVILDAARNLGAGGMRILVGILLPQVAGVMTVGLVLAFVTMLSVLSVPIMISGGSPTMITVDMAFRVNSYSDYGVANALGFISYLIAGLAAWVYIRRNVAGDGAP
jgi:ABC-type Fe3+/spermidine/putrescine transport system ATPase subunit